MIAQVRLRLTFIVWGQNIPPCSTCSSHTSNFFPAKYTLTSTTVLGTSWSRTLMVFFNDLRSTTSQLYTLHWDMIETENPLSFIMIYRVGQVVADLGLVDLDLGSSPAGRPLL